MTSHLRRSRFPTSAADASLARVGHNRSESRPKPIEIIMPREAGRISIGSAVAEMVGGRERCTHAGFLRDLSRERAECLQ